MEEKVLKKVNFICWTIKKNVNKEFCISIYRFGIQYFVRIPSHQSQKYFGWSCTVQVTTLRTISSAPTVIVVPPPMIRTVLPVPPKLIFVNWLPQPAFGYNVVCKVPIQVPHYVGSQQKNVLINITNTAYVLVQPVGQASFIFGREKKNLHWYVNQ